jgi:hypothetical protein
MAIIACCFGMAANNHEKEQYQAIPSHCSKYVLQDEARYQWEHMIPSHWERSSNLFLYLCFNPKWHHASWLERSIITRWMTMVCQQEVSRNKLCFCTTKLFVLYVMALDFSS